MKSSFVLPLRTHHVPLKFPWLTALLVLGGLLPEARAQRLTEFLAVNSVGILDEDGTPQPWIEIWNQNQLTVFTLSGYKLSSTPPSPGVPTIWTIPTIQLMPDERIIIWASGKNRSVVTAPLHTSFVLPAAAGSTLSLLNASNTVVSSFAAYPDQLANTSWGRDDTDTAITPTLTGRYETPTPREKNNTYTGSGVAGGVVFSETSRAFNTSVNDTLVNFTISQTQPDPAAEIRYNSSFPNLTVTRQQHTATTLTNGRVLFAGGLSTSNLATSELFDPAGTSWLPAASLATARRQHTATLLPDGKVLVAGGFSTAALATAELYDPTANTWTSAGSMLTARQMHTATLLNTGKVLITGGLGTDALAGSELYDPATNTWSATGSLNNARQLHTATLLPDGKVLAAGGLGAAVLAEAERYDPGTGTWSPAATMAGARQQHTATLLPNGKVLAVGGFAGAALNTAEIYDPAVNTWTAAASLATARRLHTAVLLPTGHLLVTGGTASATLPAGSSLSTSQSYDPDLNTWSSASSLAAGRYYHTANLLNNGRVLAAGGATGSTAIATASLYNPDTNAAWLNSPLGAVDVPDINSLPYTGPLTISATHMVRARVFKTGLLPGATGTQCFLKLETNARTFSSAMPITVLTTFGRAFATDPANDPDINSFLWVWEPAAPDNRARFTNLPVIATRTVVDKRGSSTFGNPKANLNLEARRNYDDEERNVSLLGMPQHSDWVFHGPYDFDRSLLHNPIIFAMSNAIGRYAVRNRMAEVFMDVTGQGLTFTGSTSGDYFGVYNVMEKLRRGSNRIDITRLDTYDNDAVSRTGGYIFKVDRRDPGDSGFSAGGQSLAYYYPKERDLRSPQRDPQEQFLTSYINTFNTKLQAASFADPVLGYATHLDVPAAIDHHLLNVWSFNVDALRLSGYWIKDRNEKMYPGPIWDFDRAMSSTDGRDSNPNTWRSQSGDLGTDFFNYTWWNRLFRDPDFYQKYIDRWAELRAGPLSRTNIEAIIDAENAAISAEAVTRDLARWTRAKRSWLRPFPAPENTNMPASQAAEVQRLKDYFRQRANFMDSQWVGPVLASAPPGYAAPGTTVTLTGPAGVPIYYTLDGSDPRPSGGAAPGAGPMLYSGPITISTNTRLRARAYKSTHTALTGANNPPLISRWGAPADVTYSTDPSAVPGDLILSEINFHPADPTPAELAINPAWADQDFEFLEIRNISGKPVNLTGANFSQGITFAFTGPAARNMGIGESLIIAANPAAFAARYGNATAVSGPWGGALSNSGETVTLLADTGAILFSVTYDDIWYPETDGSGKSLVAYEYYPFDANIPPAWRASANAGGSPGAWDPSSLPVSAGPDLSSTVSSTVNLGGAVPSAPPGPSVLAWTQTSGPGTLSFAFPSSAATTVTANLPGTYRVRLSLTVNGVTSFDEATLHLADTAAAWLARHPGIGSLTDDADQDGRNNFMEFAFLTNPSVPDGSAPPAASVVSNRMVLDYQRHSPASGVSYQVEISDGLGSFRLPNSGEITETILGDDGTTQIVRVTDTAILGTPERRFLRVKASIP